MQSLRITRFFAARARPQRRRRSGSRKDRGATLDDLREAVTTLEDAGRIARRVFGGMHPLTSDVEKYLQEARAFLRVRETQSLPEDV